MNNYYTILELNDFASVADIRKAHRRLSLKYHPDRNNGDKLCEEQFKKVQQAYEFLSDPYNKNHYDAQLDNPDVAEEPAMAAASGHASYEATDTAEKKSSSYFPWSVIVMVCVWIFRSMTSITSPEVDQNINITFENKTNSPVNTYDLFRQHTDTVTTQIHSLEPEPGKLIVNNQAMFTMGASYQAVIDAQGYPQVFTINGATQIWRYGNSTINFNGNVVTGYSNDDHNLHVLMRAGAGFDSISVQRLFNVGASKDLVVTLQSTPLRVERSLVDGKETWWYDSSTVVFRNNHVTAIHNTSNNLLVK